MSDLKTKGGSGSLTAFSNKIVDDEKPGKTLYQLGMCVYQEVERRG